MVSEAVLTTLINNLGSISDTQKDVISSLLLQTIAQTAMGSHFQSRLLARQVRASFIVCNKAIARQVRASFVVCNFPVKSLHCILFVCIFLCSFILVFFYTHCCLIEHHG